MPAHTKKDRGKTLHTITRNSEIILESSGECPLGISSKPPLAKSVNPLEHTVPMISEIVLEHTTAHPLEHATENPR